MYEHFFGLQARPFSIAPDPRFVFLSAAHQEALAHLHYGMRDGGGFVQLTGEVGTGKTTLIRRLLADAPETLDIALVLNPRLNSVELLATVCAELRLAAPDDPQSIKAWVDVLNTHLLARFAQGRRVVILIDEAQVLSQAVLEQVRLLTNLETDREKLLQVILVGQTELRDTLRRAELRQLAQRITARYHLTPLSLDDTQQYIAHRLAVAGANRPLFEAAAVRFIYRRTRGVPRLINALCDRALLGAYAEGRATVNVSLARRAQTQLGHDAPIGSDRGAPSPAGRRHRRLLALGGVSMAAAIALGWAAATGLSGELTRSGGALLTAIQNALTPASFTASTSVSNAPPPTAADPADSVADAAPTPDEPAAATQQPADHPKPEPATDFAAWLATQRAFTHSAPAFQALFGLWGQSFIDGGGSACEQAAALSLACTVRTGDWDTLRAQGRPAVLEFRDEVGRASQLLLLGLTDSQAAFLLHGRHHWFALDAITPLWLGDYLTLTPRIAERRTATLRFGQQSPDVAWLRMQLEQLIGTMLIAPESRAQFDDGMRAVVRRFQRDHDLTPDGVVGTQTLTALLTAVAQTSGPLLLTQAPEP